ncbi:MAG: putative ABC transporter permease [Ruminococcus sp.]|nr:putative ABC transporter permease [Ruminococcus sp.]
MNIFLILTFLFAVGGMTGWGLEVFYRRFVSQKHWVNPGFLTGPCLPLYGEALCILYTLSKLEDHIPVEQLWLRKLILFFIMAAFITMLEYLVGEVMLSLTHVRLWDYTNQWGNIRGMICPLYSFFWMLLSAFYYFFINSHILDALNWLSQNLAFSFGIGFFYGIFVIDLAYSANLMAKISRFADEKQIVVRLEELREEINADIEKRKAKFLLSLHTERPLREILESYVENRLDRINRSGFKRK